MGKNQYREEAHLALRELWFACDEVLRSAGVERQLGDDFTSVELELSNGVYIARLGDTMEVSCDFLRVTDDGAVDETLTVTFPEDIRDFSDSRIENEWMTDKKSGINTLGLQRYRGVAQEMLTLVQQGSIEHAA